MKIRLLSRLRRQCPILAATIAILIAAAAQAHSLKELETDLSGREPGVSFPPTESEPFPDFAFADAAGRSVTLASLRDKVAVVDFYSAGCGQPCTAQDALMAEVQNDAATAHLSGQIVFLTVALDPAAAPGAAAAHGLDPHNWRLLSAPNSAAPARLAAALRLKTATAANGVSIPEPVAYVIDREGHLRARFTGTRYDPLNMLFYLNALVLDVHHHAEGAGAAAAHDTDTPVAAPAPSLWQRIRAAL